MKTTLKSRKPVGRLAPGDFETFPIWEYATDK
jgi:hypothetical protein